MPRDKGAAWEIVICGALPCVCALADKLFPPLLLYEPDMVVVSRFVQTDCDWPIHAAARVAATELNQITLTAARAGRVLVLIERRQLVLRAQLRRHLGEMLAARAGVVERLKIGLDRRKGCVERDVQRQPADADAQIGITVGTERPHLVPDDRATERRVPLIDRLAGRRPARRHAVLRVVAVPVELRPFVLHGALDRVLPRGAMMFITTLVPVGELASTPPSLTSAIAVVSPAILIWNALASL